MPSYASDGKSDQDIFLSSAVEFDQETGVALLHEGEYAWTGGGLYLRSSDIETLDFVLINPSKSIDQEESSAATTKV